MLEVDWYSLCNVWYLFSLKVTKSPLTIQGHYLYGFRDKHSSFRLEFLLTGTPFREEVHLCKDGTVNFALRLSTGISGSSFVEFPSAFLQAKILSVHREVP